MHSRLDYARVAPDAYAAVRALNDFVVHRSGLEPLLIDLIKLRASQINGCAYCVDMHTKEARAHGAGEQWIALVAAWQESAVFSPAERAALAWTEALTLLPQTRAPDADYARLCAAFTPEQVVNITVAIGLINVWNRLAVGFRAQHPLDRPAAS
ncbi:carboxymuconolactone decarboxylase family protein [Devosia sp.]|uniref:carboxymuconolactone decarboxylase family protein n=1 Tax=Devosia sp. TaxID=1871048 RepID=UPI002EE2365D